MKVAIWQEIPSEFMEGLEELKSAVNGTCDNLNFGYEKLLKDNNLDPNLHHPEISIVQNDNDFVHNKMTVIVRVVPNKLIVAPNEG